MKRSSLILALVVMLAIFPLGCIITSASTTQTPLVEKISDVIQQSIIEGDEDIQDFDLDNCDGKADIARTEKRSSSVDVTVSADVARSIGVSAEVVSAEAQMAVGAALNLGDERATEIELKAPPNTHMYFQLTWIGTSHIGVVQNVQGSGFPIAFRAFTPNDVHIKSQYDIGCSHSSSTQDQLSQPSLETTIPSSSVTVNDSPCMPTDGYDLGNSMNGFGSEEVKDAGRKETFSHCPPFSAIIYSSVYADDSLKKVELVCPDAKTDIYKHFKPIPDPNQDLLHYASDSIAIPDGCRVDFYVEDTQGVNIQLGFQATVP